MKAQTNGTILVLALALIGTGCGLPGHPADLSASQASITCPCTGETIGVVQGDSYVFLDGTVVERAEVETEFVDFETYDRFRAEICNQPVLSTGQTVRETHATGNTWDIWEVYSSGGCDCVAGCSGGCWGGNGTYFCVEECTDECTCS